MHVADYLNAGKVLEHIDDPFVVLDGEWVYRFANDKALRFINKKAEELLGNILWDLYPEIANSAIGLKYQTVMEQKVPVSFEMHWYNNSWLKVRVYPLEDGISIFWTDASAEKRAVTQYEEISEHFKLYTQVNSNGLFYLDHKGHFQYVNDKTLELTGLTADDMLNNSVHDTMLLMNGPNQDDWNMKLSSQETINEVFGFYNPTANAEVQLHLQAIPLNGKGAPKGYLGTIEDITEKLKAHRIMEESEKWFRNVANNAPVMIWSTDANKRCNYLNNTWLDFTGRTLELESGLGWLERVHDDDQKRVLKTFNESFDHRRNFKIEFRLKHCRDGYRWVSFAGKPLYTPDNNFVGYVGSCADIHERVTVFQELDNLIKERTTELNAALERERELNLTKSRFVAIASHEFRTPLSTILSSTGLISTYLTLSQPENIQKHVDRIKGAVKHLTDILGDFLSVEKLEQGLVKVEESIFNLHQFVTETIEELETILKPGQEIISVFKGDAVILSDKKILHNVLINLLSNAIKYSSESILLEAEVHNQHITLSVTDRGIGIPAEDQEQLFKKYYRASNVGNVKGTGLGLNIVQRYVDLLNGEINFTSNGNGTTFTVTIPRDGEPENIAVKNFNASAV
ncbi:MAG: PAS domain S-box protein [Flavipsychrobacter sp.]